MAFLASVEAFNRHLKTSASVPNYLYRYLLWSVKDKGTPRGQIHLQVAMLAGIQEVTLTIDY